VGLAVNGRASAGRSARVREVHFRKGDEVAAGAVLLRLDTEELDNEIARRERFLRAGREELTQLDQMEKLLALQAEHGLARARAELELAEAELGHARARWEADRRLARLERQNAQEEVDRLRPLDQTRAVSAEEWSKANARRQEAEARLAKAELPPEGGKVEILRRAWRQAEQEAALKREELLARRKLKQSEADGAELELANLRLEREQAVVRAPHGGVVTGGEPKAGDVVEPGKVVAEIAPRGELIVEALVSNEDVGLLGVGRPARVKLDAYDYQKYGALEATVTFIAPDSELVDGPNGQRVSVYAVRLALASEAVGRGDLHGPVKLGMTGRVEVVTGQESLLGLFVRRVRQAVRLG
jgi:multidrug resistance efflux pump